MSDEEWALVAPHLTLVPEDAGQREHSLRAVFNGLRYILKTDAPGVGCPTTCRHGWTAAGCLEALADDLRAVLRLSAGRNAEPSAAIRPLTATLQNQVGNVPVSGKKLSVEADVASTFPALSGRPTRIEAEGIYSRFGGSRTDVAGGSVMLQHRAFEAGRPAT